MIISLNPLLSSLKKQKRNLSFLIPSNITRSLLKIKMKATGDYSNRRENIAVGVGNADKHQGQKCYNSGTTE